MTTGGFVGLTTIGVLSFSVLVWGSVLLVGLVFAYVAITYGLEVARTR